MRSELDFKKILITGGTSGLGLELAKNYLSKGRNVWVTGRVLNGGGLHDKRFHFTKVDFSDLSGVRDIISRLSEKVEGFDLIINNAGVLSPPEFTLTGDKIEYSFQVNYLAHLLVNEIILRNSKTDYPVVVSVTSPVYQYVTPKLMVPERSDYKAFNAYSESKYNMLLVGEYLKRRYPEKNLTFIGFNPGTFRSGIYRMQKPWFHRMYSIAAPFMRSPKHVAQLLTDILNEENLINGAVYTRKNKFRKPDFRDKEKIDEFMGVCYGEIESFLR